MIYSTQFASATFTGTGTTTLFTVPAGHVYVVRDIAITPQSSSDPDWCAVVISGASAGFLASSASIVNLETYRQVCNAVIEAGQTVQFHTAGRTYRLLVSGYDLVQL